MYVLKEGRVNWGTISESFVLDLAGISLSPLRAPLRNIQLPCPGSGGDRLPWSIDFVTMILDEPTALSNHPLYNTCPQPHSYVQEGKFQIKFKAPPS